MKKILFGLNLVLLISFSGYSIAVTNILSYSSDLCDFQEGNLKKLCQNSVKSGVAADKWLDLDSSSSDLEKYIEDLEEEEDSEEAALDVFEKIKKIDADIDRERIERYHKSFKKAELRLYLLKEDKDGDNTITPIKKEKIIFEASDLFKKAEKLARKPMVHSGGILPGPDEEEEASIYTVNKVITKLVNTAIVLVLSIGVLMMIIGGIMFLISGGDTEQTGKAKDAILYGIVGVVVSVLSFAIVKIIIGIDLGF